METLSLALRVLLSLAAVLWAIWWLKRKLSAARAGQTAVLTLVHGRSLGHKASVTVVDFEGRRLLLGVTDTSVNLLADTPAPAPSPDFEAAMEKATADDDSAGTGRRRGPADPLAGSVFSPSTWKQLGAALTPGNTK